MTTSTCKRAARRRRYLPLLAATAAGTLLLTACGPADDEPAAPEDTDAGVEDQDEYRWSGEWPDGYDFELDDPRLALGDVMQQEDHADYGKLTLGDEPSDLTDITLVDPDVISDNAVAEGNVEDLSAALEAASRFVVEQGIDSTVLTDDRIERREEWFDSVEHLFVMDDDESFRNYVRTDDGKIAYPLTGEQYGRDSDEPHIPNVVLQYDEDGARGAEYGIEVMDVSLHPDSADVPVITYKMHPRFLLLQTEDAKHQDEWGPEWEGLGAGRLHGVQVVVEYALTMTPAGDDWTDPESWLIQHVTSRGEPEERDLDIGAGDG